MNVSKLQRISIKKKQEFLCVVEIESSVSVQGVLLLHLVFVTDCRDLQVLEDYHDDHDDDRLMTTRI